MTKLKLNQILAIEKGEKSSSYAALNALHKKGQKADLYDGFRKSFLPLNEDDITFPDESKHVQVKANDIIATVRSALAEYWDLAASKDFANTEAKADVVVDGEILIKGAPPTFLLFLEKQLSDLTTLVGAMPTLDPGEAWTYDANAGLFKTESTRTAKTRKVQKAIVLYDATEHHPAQTQLITEDAIVGHWTTIKHSGAFTEARKAQLLERLALLSKAVKTAREEANSTSAERQSVAAPVFNYLFA